MHCKKRDDELPPNMTWLLYGGGATGGSHERRKGGFFAMTIVSLGTRSINSDAGKHFIVMIIPYHVAQVM